MLTHQSIKTVSFNLSCNPAQEYASSCLFINLFMANIPISYALEYQTTKVFLVFMGYKIETLVRNELVYYIHLRKSIDQINILVQVFLVFIGYKIETLVRNELVYYIHLPEFMDQINNIVQVYLESCFLVF